MKRPEHAQSGETLVESLVAILIMSLVFAFLVTGVLVSARINDSVKASDASVDMESSQKATPVRVTIGKGLSTYATAQCDVYVAEDNSDGDGEKTKYYYYEKQ